MRPLHYYITLVLALLPCAGRTDGFGATGSLLMAEGLAVRAMGLSRAFAAMADDEASLQANPAGLARSRGLALGGGHVLGLLDDRISYLNAAWRVGPAVGLGLQAALAGSEDEARDAFGVVQGSFANREMLLGLGLGLQLTPGWRLGLAAKGLREDLAGSASLGLAGDIGLQADLPRGWSAGASVMHAGTQVDPGPGRSSLSTPLRLQAGVAAPFFTPAWQVEADVEGLPLEGQARLLLGTELGFALPGFESRGFAAKPRPSANRVALRAGAQLGLLKAEDPRLSLGAGLHFAPHLQLDYALANLGALGLTHRFSLGLRFPPGPPRTGPRGEDLSAPQSLVIVPQIDGLLISWQHDESAVQGYNLYSDYGVLVERLNNAPLNKTRQRFVKVERSRTYNFYVKPVGSDGKEGPSSAIKTVRVK